MKKYPTNFANFNTKDVCTLLMTSIIKNQFENDVMTTDMKSAGIHLLNYYSFRHTQPFSFWDKSTGPFVVLALY